MDEKKCNVAFVRQSVAFGMKIRDICIVPVLSVLSVLFLLSLHFGNYAYHTPNVIVFW